MDRSGLSGRVVELVGPLVVGRAVLAQSGMATVGIVEAFAVVEDRHPGLGAGAEAVAVAQLPFQGGEEALGHGVASGVADRAQRGSDAGFTAAATKGQAGVLAALVAVMDQALGRRRQMAMSRASMTSSVPSWSAIAQPTIRRAHTSRTTGRGLARPAGHGGSATAVASMPADQPRRSTRFSPGDSLAADLDARSRRSSAWTGAPEVARLRSWMARIWTVRPGRRCPGRQRPGLQGGAARARHTQHAAPQRASVVGLLLIDQPEPHLG
jgi:hypothetical protein